MQATPPKPQQVEQSEGTVGIRRPRRCRRTSHTAENREGGGGGGREGYESESSKSDTPLIDGKLSGVSSRRCGLRCASTSDQKCDRIRATTTTGGQRGLRTEAVGWRRVGDGVARRRWVECSWLD
jgi:hypothetical protein